MVKSSLDVKTLDVKIYELREEPENLQLLLDVISMIYENMKNSWRETQS